MPDVTDIGRSWFQLLDEATGTRWHLDAPIRDGKNEFEFWAFVNGEPLDPYEYTGFSIPIQYNGTPLDFTITAFSIPVFRTSKLREFEDAVGKTDFVTVPVEIDGHQPGEFEIFVVTKTISCFDWQRSSYDLNHNESRIDKRIRMVSDWFIDDEAVPDSIDIFRVAEWPASIVVSEKVRRVFAELQISSPTFESR